MDDLSMITVNADSRMVPILASLLHDAACAADVLEATAADIGEAIAELSRGAHRPEDLSRPEVLHRLRARRNELACAAAELRETIRVRDDAVTARMAAALIAESGRVEQAEVVSVPVFIQIGAPSAPRTLQVVK